MLKRLQVENLGDDLLGMIKEREPENQRPPRRFKYCLMISPALSEGFSVLEGEGPPAAGGGATSTAPVSSGLGSLIGGGTTPAEGPCA